MARALRGIATALLWALLSTSCGSDASTTVAPSTSVAPSATPARAEFGPQRVSISAGRFTTTATGEPFVPRGVNYVRFTAGADRTLDPAYFDPGAMTGDFARLRENGWNTVRMFLDTCGCTTTTDGIAPDWVDTVAAALDIAAANDLVVILTSNDLPDAPYGEAANRGATERMAGYRNAHMLSAAGHRAFVDYWSDMIDALDTAGARLDVVLGWSILNEQWLFTDQPPLSLVDGDVETRTGTYPVTAMHRAVADNLLALIDDVGAAIRSRHDGALVTMGFFAPKTPHPTTIGGDWFVDTKPLAASSLDFFDFHAYPGGDLDLAGQADNFGVPADRPVIMGEVGAFASRYPDVVAGAVATQRWIAASCELGWDGWLYWAHDRLIGVTDATWGLTSEDGFMLEALGAVAQPDPCVVTLDDPNAASGATASASRELEAEPATAAIDGNPATQWGSGADAPQWIQIDLTEPTTLRAVRLRVAQYPAGTTTHIVDLLSAGNVVRSEVTTGHTDQGDVIEVSFDPPIDDIDAVRITTTASPSWVAWNEVELLRG